MELETVTVNGVNKVTHDDTYFFFTVREVDGADIIERELQVRGASTTSTTAYMYAATTEQECIDKAAELNLILELPEEEEEEL